MSTDAMAPPEAGPTDRSAHPVSLYHSIHGNSLSLAGSTSPLYDDYYSGGLLHSYAQVCRPTTSDNLTASSTVPPQATPASSTEATLMQEVNEHKETHCRSRCTLSFLVRSHTLESCSAVGSHRRMFYCSPLCFCSGWVSSCSER